MGKQIFGINHTTEGTYKEPVFSYTYRRHTLSAGLWLLLLRKFSDTNPTMYIDDFDKTNYLKVHYFLFFFFNILLLEELAPRRGVSWYNKQPIIVINKTGMISMKNTLFFGCLRTIHFEYIIQLILRLFLNFHIAFFWCSDSFRSF